MKIRIALTAIAGLLLAGTTYAQSSNSFDGVGLLLGTSGTNHVIKVMQVVPNTSAAKAGLTRGLVVEKVDGTPTVGMKLRQCVDLIRGPEGTTVTLELVDPSNDTTNTVELTREKIVVPKMRRVSPSPAPAPAPGP